MQMKADMRQTILILAKWIELLRQIPGYSFKRNNNNNKNPTYLYSPIKIYLLLNEFSLMKT